MSKVYSEPQASFLVLDYNRPDSTRLCLQSIKNRVKFPSRVIYCHNGEADYPFEFLKDGLIDELIMPRKNSGLGLGTRALFAACFSPLAIYWQSDQIMGRDFEQDEIDAIMSVLSPLKRIEGTSTCMSISLAGAVCGQRVYSERAHAILTDFYRHMEHTLPLSYGGAGPYHDVEWREGQIQSFYRQNGFFHHTDWPAMAIDNGRDAVRENPDGSVWKHYPDTKQLWLVSGPVVDRFVYPKFTPEEWDFVIQNQFWPPGKIPENEEKDSFHVWN